MNYLRWCIILGIAASCSRGEPVRVSGKIDQAGGARIYLDEQGLTEIRSRDSTRLKKDGTFMLKDRISVPTFYNLHLGDYKSIPLLLKPGDQAVISSTGTNFARKYTVEGSEESLLIQDLSRHMAVTKRKLDSLNRKAGSGGSASPDSLQAEYSRIYDAQRRYNIQFIIDHLTSMSVIYALYQKFDDNNLLLNTYRDVQLYKIASVALDTIYPESEFVQSLSRDAANLEQDFRNRKLKNFMNAMPAAHPEVCLPDPYGDTIALSSLAGKVILLSFWASWDPPSLELNQEFKKLYRRYHDKGFEIYQVSFDSELEPWMKAISFDELPWIHVSELSYPLSSVALRYNVKELPTFFLLDRDGEITGKNYGARELERKISELLMKKQAAGN